MSRYKDLLRRVESLEQHGRPVEIVRPAMGLGTYFRLLEDGTVQSCYIGMMESKPWTTETKDVKMSPKEFSAIYKLKP